MKYKTVFLFLFSFSLCHCLPLRSSTTFYIVALASMCARWQCWLKLVRFTTIATTIAVVVIVVTLLFWDWKGQAEEW